MDPALQMEITSLDRLSAKELKAELWRRFGERTRGTNRTHLIRRLVWRLQAQAYGALKERALARAAQLEADVQAGAGGPFTSGIGVVPQNPDRSPRLPRPRRVSNASIEANRSAW